MVVFDAPSYSFQHLPYHKRYKVLVDNVPGDHPFNVFFFFFCNPSLPSSLLFLKLHTPLPFTLMFVQLLSNRIMVGGGSSSSMPVSTMIGMFVQCVIESGGEGAILQKYDGVYEQGRSRNLIKLKVSSLVLFLGFF